MDEFSSCFHVAAVKSLSSVEVNGLCSNQHEFHGINAFRDIFGFERNRFDATVIYIGETEYRTDISRGSAQLTWYDARKDDPYRTEYRLYYSGTAVSQAREGDMMILGVMTDGSLYVVIIQRNSDQEETQLYTEIKSALGIFSLHNYFVMNDLQNERVSNVLRAV